jgi:tetratricopeptide (TPR) repeat protein
VELPDTLFALCDLLGEVTPIPESLALEEIVATYGLVAALEWPQDELCERVELLTRLSYLAWSRCRRWATYPQAKLWRDRCVGHVLSREMVRDFLAVAFSARSEHLNERFLVDPAILLATCVEFENVRNREPASVVANARLAYRWVRDRSVAFDFRDDLLFFSGDLALSVGVGFKQLGRLGSARRWLDRAHGHFALTANPAPHLARTAFARATVLQECHEFEEVLRLLPPILETLQEHEVSREFNYARLLEAMAMKDCGRTQDAVQRLIQMKTCTSIRHDPLALSLVLITLAEQEALAGNFDHAIDLFRQALPIVEQAKAPLVTAQFYGSLGEGFRDRGFLREAENAYRMGIATYSGAGMIRREAYVRVILAEMLLADGRDHEAAVELLAAMPTIDGERLAREGVVAVAMLRESVHRHRLSSRLLREVREQLEVVNDGGD